MGQDQKDTDTGYENSRPAAEFLSKKPYNVGFSLHHPEYTDSRGDNRILSVAVWYPSREAPETVTSIPGLPAGSVCPDGRPAAEGPYPLIIFSHGFGGCGIQSTFFTRALAQAGYVVAAPDHRDAALCSSDPYYSGTRTSLFDLVPFLRPGAFDDTTYRDRRDDIRAVIDWALKENTDPESILYQMIDPDRIGISGHSLGGYTAMGMAGGWQSWRDDRIRAALLFSPYIQPFLDDSLIGRIEIPLMFHGGTADLLITPWIARKNGAYDRVPAPKFYVEITDAGHMDWSDTRCIGYDSIDDCVRSDDKARVITAYGTAFFNLYLKDKEDALALLITRDPDLSDLRYAL